MIVTLGSTTLAAGTLAHEPSSFVQAVGSKHVQPIHRIRAAKARFADRGNRSYSDVIEVDYSYTTPALAKAGIISRRQAALAASGTLTYDTGTAATAIGPATVTQVELVQWQGCAFTLRYTILVVES